MSRADAARVVKKLFGRPCTRGRITAALEYAPCGRCFDCTRDWTPEVDAIAAAFGVADQPEPTKDNAGEGATAQPMAEEPAGSSVVADAAPTYQPEPTEPTCEHGLKFPHSTIATPYYCAGPLGPVVDGKPRHADPNAHVARRRERYLARVDEKPTKEQNR